MSLWPNDIAKAAASLVERLTTAGLMIATAESCTGGLIVGSLTDIPGSSRVVDRGFVTYSNDAKMEMLGVTQATLSVHGAVSRQTALEMVHGALARSKADIAVAVTGIAGPGGGTADKPVGLVHIAASRPGGTIVHRAMLYGDLGREGIRLATIRTALEMLADQANVSA